MSSEILLNPNIQTPTEYSQIPEKSLCKVMIRSGIWIFGVPSWLFGVADRGIAALADGYLTVTEISQFLFASFLFISWLYLKPGDTTDNSNFVSLQRYEKTAPAYQQNSLNIIRNRMQELSDRYVISQAYTLPFPYFCQIYHLLNLKHLEDIHSFSLGNLRIVGVSQFQPTHGGGWIKFQTVLDSPFNVLRIWRQPIVEVELVLHTPYTVELKIPAYQGKEISVIFNVLPLNQEEHILLVDIYSDLKWPKPILKFIMHLAANLTLLEDLPYLRKLAERNLHRLVERNSVSTHKTMQLFQRFVDLYGSSADVDVDVADVDAVNQDTLANIVSDRNGSASESPYGSATAA